MKLDGVFVTNFALNSLNFKSSNWLASQVDPFCDLNNEPIYGCLLLIEPRIKSSSPTLDVNVKYLLVGDTKTSAYSYPDCKYTGVEKLNVVGALPSTESGISFGSTWVSPKGTITPVGEPSLIVLIWIVTGETSSFVLK